MTDNIEFQITSIQGEAFERECINLFLRLNKRTISTLIPIEAFKDYESARLNLEACIIKSLKFLYPEKE